MHDWLKDESVKLDQQFKRKLSRCNRLIGNESSYLEKYDSTVSYLK